MMHNKELQINILAHSNDRINFTNRSIDEIKKISNKEKVSIVICFSNASESRIWEDKSHEIRSCGIESESICIDQRDPDGTNYMSKIRHLAQSELKYSCSMDDDILISSHLWDYIIDNLSILDDENNLFIAPLISNGIPSVDMFIEDFCNAGERNELHSIFLNTHIDNLWGADYQILNKNRDKWGIGFYDDIKRIDHYYKGIHPVRVSVDAHKKLSEIICENPNKLMSINNYRLEKLKFPYFCNSFYFIKTDIWKKIISNESLFRDPYDEVPLNLYMENNDLNMIFVRNGFCLHMAYNTINKPGVNNQKEIEKHYMDNLLHKI
jgi:hypothetical protein